MENLPQGLLEFTRSNCILGIVGLVIGVYPGLCGPKAVTAFALTETALIFGLRYFNLNELANDLVPILIGTVVSGSYFYLKTESMKKRD